MLRQLLTLWLVFLCLAVPMAASAKVTVLSGKTEQCTKENTRYTSIEQRYERGIFFRIERCGYPTSYVMGTMHSDSPRLALIFNEAKAIIKPLRAVGFEFVEDENTAIIAAQYMYLPSTSSVGLSGMISPQQFNLLAQALESRMKIPRQVAERLRPWAAAITLQYPPSVSDGIVLDKRLQDYARAMQKDLFSLESPAEQFMIFDNIPHAKQLVMLHDTIGSIDELDDSNEAFLRAFINHDLKTLHQLAEESFMMTSDAELREYIEQNLLYKRNRIMAERIQPRLIKGNIMIAIGALHLMGEKGVLAHLEKQGWRVEVIQSTH